MYKLYNIYIYNTYIYIYNIYDGPSIKGSHKTSGYHLKQHQLGPSATGSRCGSLCKADIEATQQAVCVHIVCRCVCLLVYTETVIIEKKNVCLYI
jgi:hypothetical protein